jgi:hypothetical protein
MPCSAYPNGTVVLAEGLYVFRHGAVALLVEGDLIKQFAL